MSALIGRVHDERRERRMHVVAAADVDPAQRVERIDGLRGRHPHPRPAQQADEMHDVTRERFHVALTPARRDTA